MKNRRQRTYWFMTFVIAAILAAVIAGCGHNNQNPFDIRSVQSYHEIPGITPEEIAAIDKLVSERDSFSYGHLKSTEAFALPDGTDAGFTAKFCELLSGLFGVEFVQAYYDWDSLKNGIDSKEIDFTGELTRTSERVKSYHMTHSIAGRVLRLFTYMDSSGILRESDLEGFRIAFFKGTITAESVVRFYPNVSFEIVEVSSFAEAAAMLRAGLIDAFVGDGVADLAFEEYGSFHSKEFFSLVYTPVSMSTANSELKPIISAMNKYLVAGGINLLDELYSEGKDEYARYKLDNALTSVERAYLEDLLSRNAKVKVALEHDNYPTSFYNENDKEFQGIAIDVLAEISRITGIEFEVASRHDEPWAEIFEKLRTGKVSLVSQLLYSDERKDSFLWSAVPYSASNYALLSKIEYPNLSSHQVILARVGVVRKTAHEDLYNLWFPDSTNVKYYDTQNEALEALENGDIDLLMASEFRLLTQIHYREKSGYKVNIYFSVPTESFFGFNKNETVLCSIIDKAQGFVNTEIIATNWTSRIFDYSSKYSAQMTTILSVFSGVLFLTLILIIILWQRNHRFRKVYETQDIKLSTILKSIPDVLYSKDANYRYTSCNESFEKLAGQKESEIIGKTALEVFTDSEGTARYDMAIRFSEMDKNMMREYSAQKVEDWYTFPDGTRGLFECLKVPLIRDGKIIGLMGISRDITEHKKAEEAAQAASEAKSTFLAHMSHEIRTPMNAIAGMTELVLREDLPPAIYEYIMNIKHAGANMLSLINDILDFSKIEAGGLEIVPAKYSLVSLINDVLIIIRMKVSEKPLLFTVNIDSEIPNRLIGDETRIRQILLNVLGNAVKYTDEGFISFNVSGQVENDTVTLIAEVSDSGIGIKSEDLGKLFGGFVRFDKVKNRGIQGSGLGLAITKNLCQEMGGDITVCSEYGVGSTFTVTLPQQIIPDSERFAHVPNPGHKSVLLYETRSLYIDSIAQAIEDLGVRCTPVCEEPEFLEELKRNHYSFVFVSSLLAEAAWQLIGELEIETKLVLLLEFGEAPAMRNVRTIDMPVHCASIANILNETAGNILYTEAGSGSVRFIAPSAEILVVDDVNANLKVAEGLLLPYQVHTDVCTSGQDAITLIQNKRYDLVFMDHMMPGMDGVETTKIIRSLEDGSGYYQNVPIIALTANAILGVKEMFLQNGMNDFLSKPVDTTKLNSLLEKWIPEEKKERYRKLRIKRPLDNSELIELNIEGVDVQAGIVMTGGTLENYSKTLSIFYTDGLEKIEKIQECAAKGNTELYVIYLHSIKGTAASIGAWDISEQAKALELAGIRGDLAFIKENTERFLRGLEILFNNINAAIAVGSEPETKIDANPEDLKKELLRLKAALQDSIAEEVDDIMDVLGGVKWSGNAEGLFKEIHQHVSLFNYPDAAASIDSLLDEL